MFAIIVRSRLPAVLRILVTSHPEPTFRAEARAHTRRFNRASSLLGGGEVPPPAEKREGTGPIRLNPTTGRRRALADWIATPENPLTARVMVNRIWQYHFGRGIVATPWIWRAGTSPSHPELLDWLATEFVARGWSVKHVHRLILHSSAYPSSSVGSPEAADKDPNNLLLSRFSRRRLTSDEIRDSVLAVTGGWNPETGGRPVVVPLSNEELTSLTQRPDDAWVVTADAPNSTTGAPSICSEAHFPVAHHGGVRCAGADGDMSAQ